MNENLQKCLFMVPLEVVQIVELQSSCALVLPTTVSCALRAAREERKLKLFPSSTAVGPWIHPLTGHTWFYGT